jgi:hypothetical protein
MQLHTQGRRWVIRVVQGPTHATGRHVHDEYVTTAGDSPNKAIYELQRAALAPAMPGHKANPASAVYRLQGLAGLLLLIVLQDHHKGVA